MCPHIRPRDTRAAVRYFVLLAGPDDSAKAFAYVPSNPVVFTDPLGLMEVRYKEKKRAGDPDIPCSCPTAGDCAPADAAVTGYCEELSCGQARMKTILIASSDITIWNGMWPCKNRRPTDKHVKDARPTYEHELAVHIHPAISAAVAVLSKFEQNLYGSKAACESAMLAARTLAVREFRETLRRTMQRDN